VVKFLIPFILFVVLAVFLAMGLKLDPKAVPSPLIDKPAPAFLLPVLADHQQQFKPEDLRGQVWLLNVWASWCVSCREEHPIMLELAKQTRAAIVGLNYKDEAVNAEAWLNNFGNPYRLSVMDGEGRIGIDYGVYGVPETFIIDKRGVIRYKHTGPVTVQDLQQVIVPWIQRLEGESV
jgi:cytochrome c biogenesis protein CcmG, thiol:disulfide interchange protein DsbE